MSLSSFIPFDVIGRDQGAVVKLDARSKVEGRALGVFGKIIAFGERRMVVTDLAEFFDESVVQRHQKIVRTRGAVMLLQRV